MYDLVDQTPEQFHQELLHLFPKDIDLQKLHLLRIAIRCVHQEVIKENSKVSATKNSQSEYNIAEDIKNELIRVYTCSGVFFENHLRGSDVKKKTIVKSYPSIKNYAENKNSEENDIFKKGEELTDEKRLVILNERRLKCIEILVFYKEVYNVWPIIDLTKENLGETSPFIKAKKKHKDFGFDLKVSSFNIAYRQSLTLDIKKSEDPINKSITPAEQLEDATSLTDWYICYYWTHENNVGKAILKTDNFQNPNGTKFEIHQRKKDKIFLQSTHVEKQGAHTAYISIFLKDDTKNTHRTPPIFSHLSLNSSSNATPFLMGGFSSFREKKRLPVVGLILCLKKEQLECEKLIKSEVNIPRDIFSFIFQKRFEVPDWDFEINELSKYSGLIDKKLSGNYMGHFFDLVAQSLERFTLFIDKTGVATMIKGDEKAESKIYFRRHLAKKEVIIGYLIEDDDSDRSGKNQYKVTSSRVYFILKRSKTEKDDNIVLKGVQFKTTRLDF